MRIVNLFLTVLVIGICGCGSSQALEHAQLVKWITVIDLDGTEQRIPGSELIDPETGKPTVQKVLVIDRRANKQGFIDAKELQSQSPSAPRYLPVESDSRG